MFHHAAMQWDHRPGTVKCFELASVAKRYLTREQVLAEIAKCELVCANCHAVRTYNRRIAPKASDARLSYKEAD